jgi:superfamily I DNA and RNA helicase
MSARRWENEVNAAVRKSKIETIGQADILNGAQATVVVSILNAYGDSPSAFLYIEPRTGTSTDRPPDVLLCHEQVGLLFIEVKGDKIEDIHGLNAGKLLVRRQGYTVPQDPIRQAEQAMYGVKNAVERKLGYRQAQPLYNVMAAFPNISESDWVERGYDQAYDSVHLLFRETLETSQRLKKRVGMLVTKTMEESKKATPLNIEQVSAIKAVFGDSAVINDRRQPRAWIDKQKLGEYVDYMASLEKYLSSEQQELSRLAIDGYPRLIRGVAGSGKSVVLANLAARYLNRQLNRSQDMFDIGNRDIHIGVLCFNRALVPFLRGKIGDAYKQQTLAEMPAKYVNVTHFNGLFYMLSEQGVLKYIPISVDAVERAVRYREQLNLFSKRNPDWFASIQFDAAFVDEGQDLRSEEYQLLLELVKPNTSTGERALVIFYDDAQNLYARTRPNWKQIGIDVQRGDRARVMRECFRNTREIVEVAFNVLLGSQACEKQLVQTRTFADVNYLKQLGLVEELGDHFRIRFTERSFEKPAVRMFSSRRQEREWIAEEVVRLIEEEQVRPEDILILFDKSAEFDCLPELIGRCAKNGDIRGFIRPYNNGNKQDQDKYIFRENFLTISTTHGAKGYDAQIVFIVGTDQFELDEKGRASFYVGCTRAKMMLYLSGVEGENTLLEEAEKVIKVC